MHHGNVAHQRHREDFRQQMCAQQVKIELMQVEICTSHENLGHQPVVLRISRQEDGIVFSWSLLQLQEKEGGVVQSSSPTFLALLCCGKEVKWRY